MHNIINKHDLAHVKWVVRNALEQEAITADRETKVDIRTNIEEETLTLQKRTAKIHLIRTVVFIFCWFT